MWFIGVELEQETSAPPPKKNPGSAPVSKDFLKLFKLISSLPGSWSDQIVSNLTNVHKLRSTSLN